MVHEYITVRTAKLAARPKLKLATADRPFFYRETPPFAVKMKSRTLWDSPVNIGLTVCSDSVKAQRCATVKHLDWIPRVLNLQVEVYIQRQ